MNKFLKKIRKTYKLQKQERIKYFIVAYALMMFGLYLFYKSIIISIVGGVSCIFFEKYYARYKYLKERDTMIVEFKDLLYILSAQLTTGRSMQEALIESEILFRETYPKNSPMLKRLNVINRKIIENKANEEVVLKEFANESDIEDIQNFVDVYTSIRKTGGDMQRIITNSIETIMDKMQIQKEIKTLMKQKEFEAKIVGIMPVIVILFLNIFSPDYLNVLYITVAGRIIMTISLICFVIAGIWLFKLMEVKV